MSILFPVGCWPVASSRASGPALLWDGYSSGTNIGNNLIMYVQFRFLYSKELNRIIYRNKIFDKGYAKTIFERDQLRGGTSFPVALGRFGLAQEGFNGLWVPRGPKRSQLELFSLLCLSLLPMIC